ncbi:YcjF family protein [Polyangium jinanense]|uniref:DUF697 domain-containing protein n=1 Tax=Polyangium jinanense TaxID=2829994 RepID=A0A9X4ATF4_9BACT|nr:DUF697 domain-containing protein [Polyangium jinanense]MDC3955512.1 DUF697 domain-containing protein [Polyangium jinanense]MDC3982147.1 DUF697 domain-containing protein [Polyangium jinanense]
MAGEATKDERTETSTKHEPMADGVEAKSEVPSNDVRARERRAEAILRRNVLWALVAGVLPVPAVDLVAIKGIQLKMLKELADLYEVKFTRDVAKALLGSLVSSTWSVGVGATLGYGFAKFVPVVGSALGLLSTPLIAGATTHALGKVFVMHFETGGTFLNFDPNAMRSHFRSELEKAKETVAAMQQEP